MQERPSTEGRLTEPSAARSAEADPDRQTAAPESEGGPRPAGSAEIGVVDVRRVWQDVLKDVQRRRRATQILLESATVAGVDGRTLKLSMPTAGMAKRVVETGNAEPLRAALHQVLGVDWAIDCSSDQQTPNTQRPDSRPSSTPAQRPASPARSQPSERAAGPSSRSVRPQASSAGDDWPMPEAPPEHDDPAYEDEIPDDYDPAATVPPASVHDPEEAAMTLLASELGGKKWDPDRSG